jgi:magnesium-transporting ATPase (P-type)
MSLADFSIISRLPASDIVSVDIVKIILGSKVLADLYLLDASYLTFYTAESNAIAASIEPSDSNCKYVSVFLKTFLWPENVRTVVIESMNIALQRMLCNGFGVCVGLYGNTIFGCITKEAIF